MAKNNRRRARGQSATERFKALAQGSSDSEKAKEFARRFQGLDNEKAREYARRLGLPELPADHPFVRATHAIASWSQLPENHPLRQFAPLPTDRPQGEMPTAGVRAHRPRLNFQGLDDAIADLKRALQKNPTLRSPTRGLEHVTKFLKAKKGITVPRSQERTIKRRIAESLRQDKT